MSFMILKKGWKVNMADYINSVMEDFRENNLKNAYKILEAESFKRRIFSYNLEDNLEYFERKHNDYFYSVALVFYLFFSLLNCIGFNKNFSWSYSFSLYIFLNLVLLWVIIYIFFRQKDYIYKIGKVFLGNVLLLILIFLYFPFFDDVVLDQGRYFNVILTDNKMKFILLIFAFCIYYYSVVKIYNKFSFVGIISNDLNRKKQEKYNLYKQQNEFYRNQNKFENPWSVIDCTTKEKNLDYPIKSLPNFATRMGYRPNKIKPIPAIEQYENKYASLEKDIKQEQDIINTPTVNSNDNNKIACIENNEEKTINIQLEKPKNSDTKSNPPKNMKLVFYKLFGNVISVEKAKDLPFEEFWKIFLNTYKNQIITIENVTFIFEKNRFYKEPKKKKKHYYVKNSMKTNYSLYRTR